MSISRPVSDRINFFVIFITIPATILFSDPAYSLSKDPTDVEFLFYGDKKSLETFIQMDVGGPIPPSFRRNYPTVFLIHGFLDNRTAFQGVKDEYMTRTTDPPNIIIVDWSKLGKEDLPNTITGLISYLPLYFKVVQNVENVGGRVAEFIEHLYSSRALNNIHQVHLVGHSLGSHVSGNCGYKLKQLLGAEKGLGRITALDPAGILFAPPIIARPLSARDADFVDIIHSDARTAGSSSIDGMVDFFPNGGNRQPGCDQLFGSVCSHTYAIDLYASSFRNEYRGCVCNVPILDSSPHSLDKCLRPCNNPTRIGVFCPSTARGLFYLVTPNPP